MILARRPRSPTLAPLVESLWTYDGQLTHGFERVLPSGRMQLLVNLHEDAFRDYRLDGRLAHKTRGAVIQGVHTAPRVVDTACQRSICGVSFAPASASPFLGMPASALTGRVVDLSEIWGRDSPLLRERLLQAPTSAARLDVLEAALLARGRASEPRDAAAAIACSLLMGGASVRAVGVQLGLSPRRLIERFQAHVGVKPKLFARIARFQHVLASARGEMTWASLAGEHGFSDQAHLVREFRAFSGATPVAYRPRSDEDRNHVPLDEWHFSSIRGGPPPGTLRQ
ncbi:AraC family transcriptional regulator [Myxococcus sp. AM001]|uniref:helix-turn-helix domain-containing protein n=1 Tax=Myxococcus vastator TaxID=2709664 RepID=UPI0013CFC152|nr:AraC family transcriptional regulator [Myxococcus vastator]NVJ06134.1 AraC family transcriptional regulator [Myxococcus sp. AM001]